MRKRFEDSPNEAISLAGAFGYHYDDPKLLREVRYPYRKLFRLLKDAGYQGYCSAEIPASPDPIGIMKYYRALFLAYQNVI